MPEFKRVWRGMMLLAVDLAGRIQPGTFEHALDYLIDREFDVSSLRARAR